MMIQFDLEQQIIIIIILNMVKQPKVGCSHCDKLCGGSQGIYDHIQAKHSNLPLKNVMELISIEQALSVVQRSHTSFNIQRSAVHLRKECFAKATPS